jgi:hypothetical protein
MKARTYPGVVAEEVTTPRSLAAFFDLAGSLRFRVSGGQIYFLGSKGGDRFALAEMLW